MIDSFLKSKKIVFTYLFISLAILGSSHDAIAQSIKNTKPNNTSAKIYVTSVGFRKNNKVYLRWKLNNAREWRLANKNGYIIERAEAGSMNFKKITSVPLLPISNKEALKLANKSNDFNMMRIVLKKPNYSNPKEAENDNMLYGMYFILSSISSKSAIMSASGFVDSTIQKDKAYKYRVTVANIDLSQQQSNIAEVDLAENKMPPPPQINGNFIRKSAILQWDNKDILKDYFSISIEKSTDSIHFTKYNEKPYLTNLNTDKNNTDSNKTKQLFADTLVSLGNKYFYRIKGLNIFGVESIPSNVFSGIVTLDLTEAPRVNFLDSLNGKYILDWKISTSQNALVNKYQVLYSATGKENSYQLVKEVKGGGNLVASLDLKLSNSNYFRVKAIGFKKEELLSVPYLYQKEDSFPPAVPQGLTGTINKKGIVHLHWNKNTESDFRGYKIVKRYNDSKAYSLMNAVPRVDTFFVDTLPLNQLSLKVSYSVTSLDNRYNESEKSNFVTVEVPDTIPPVAPRFENIQVDSLGYIHLDWIKSFSKDVKNYVIYRKVMNDSNSNWIKYVEKTNIDTSYIDKEVKKNNTYFYKIVAIDKGDLVSLTADSISIKTVSRSKVVLKPITKLIVYVTHEYKYIELSWLTGNTEGVVEYQIYRSSNKTKGAVYLLASLPLGTKRYVDEDISPKTTYTYYVKAVYQSGKSSPFEKIEAAY